MCALRVQGSAPGSLPALRARSRLAPGFEGLLPLHFREFEGLNGFALELSAQHANSYVFVEIVVKLKKYAYRSVLTHDADETTHNTTTSHYFVQTLQITAFYFEHTHYSNKRCNDRIVNVFSMGLIDFVDGVREYSLYTSSKLPIVVRMSIVCVCVAIRKLDVYVCAKSKRSSTFPLCNYLCQASYTL